MSAAIQSVIVFVIVAVATGYALLKFMPAAWRRGLASRVAAWGARSGLSVETARRVEAKLSSGGACGSCDSCKACATPANDATGGKTPTISGIPIRRA